MKKLIIALILLIPVLSFADEYIVVSKAKANNIFKEIRENKFQVVEVKKLDEDICGLLLIVYR